MSDEIETGISPAENFGSRVQALVILLSPLVMVAVLFAEHARSIKHFESTARLMGIWAPSYLVYMAFAGMRYFRPASMPPVLSPYSEHILKMKRLRRWGYFVSCVCIVLFAILSVACGDHWFIEALPILACIALSGSILLKTYATMRVPAGRMPYVPGPSRRNTLIVTAMIALSTGVLTVYLWGSFWAVLTVLFCYASALYFFSLLNQRPWAQPDGSEPEEESGSMPVLR